jgi:hypothetical protein
MCAERQLLRTGSKTVLIQRLVGYYFTNVDKFESAFESMFEEFEVKWEKAKRRMRDEDLHAYVVLAGRTVSPPCAGGFRTGFLTLVWHVKKMGVSPKETVLIPTFSNSAVFNTTQIVSAKTSAPSTQPYPL